MLLGSNLKVVEVPLHNAIIEDVHCIPRTISHAYQDNRQCIIAAEGIDKENN